MKRGLNNNQLSELPPGVFDNLGSLTWLYVGKNKKEKKKKREEGCFSCIFRLSSIFFSFPPRFFFVLLMKRGLVLNQLSELRPGVFDNLGSLTELYVGKDKKEKKKGEEGCLFCLFHLSSIFVFILSLVSFCFSHEKVALR